MEVNPLGVKITEPAKARNESPLAQFSEKIGKVQIIEKETNPSKSKASSLSHGFHCATCNASFTSSDAYLDHCNGRVHQRNLGLSLRVERVDEVDRVKTRLQKLTQKRYMTESIIESKSTAHFENKLEKAEKDLETLKEERKIRKKSKKEKTIKEEETASIYEAKNETEEDIMALMGFKSFT